MREAVFFSIYPWLSGLFEIKFQVHSRFSRPKKWLIPGTFRPREPKRKRHDDANNKEKETYSPGSHCNPVYISQGIANETRYDQYDVQGYLNGLVIFLELQPNPISSQGQIQGEKPIKWPNVVIFSISRHMKSMIKITLNGCLNTINELH